jgi:hypothetical protein
MNEKPSREVLERRIAELESQVDRLQSVAAEYRMTGSDISEKKQMGVRQGRSGKRFRRFFENAGAYCYLVSLCILPPYRWISHRGSRPRKI